MAGLYLHIPFCKQACHYCNFHFSTSVRYKREMVAAIAAEIRLRRTYLPETTLHSVYFGGGTPSLLDQEELSILFAAIKECFKVAPEAEITLEANPDDIDEERLAWWAASPINRLSIGIQSFAEADLRYMNRAHNATEALACIKKAKQYGFQQLTADLIYGAPTTTDAVWEHNVHTLIQAGVQHLSCYALTVEPKTALHHQITKGTSPPVDDQQAARQFELLQAWVAAAGYEQYEVSNFALPGHWAVHNSNYWRSQPYLGVGPAAHSFDGYSRQWNVANNAHYIKAVAALQNDESSVTPLFEKEVLSPADRYNEYVLTGLRTRWGVDIDRMEPQFRAHFVENATQYVETGHLKNNKNVYFLKQSSLFLADGIAADLFLID